MEGQSTCCSSTVATRQSSGLLPNTCAGLPPGSQDKRKAQLSTRKQLLDSRHVIWRQSRTHKLSLISSSATALMQVPAWELRASRKQAKFLSAQDFPSPIITMPFMVSKQIFYSVSIKASCAFLVLLSSPQSARSLPGWSSKETSLTKWIS